MSMRVILDLETLAVSDAADFTEPAAAPANYKDPEKIAAYIAQAQRDQVERAALYPWTCRIVAIGTAVDEQEPTVILTPDEREEREALVWFWREVAAEDEARIPRPIIGFNHRTFDLPILMARSILLGVPHLELNLDRYRTPHVDVLDVLTWRGAIPARSLTWFARRFGLPVEDTVRGRDIATLAAAGDWEAIRAHCASDVRLTRALAQRIGVW
jgi:hypothetical protein